MVIVKSTPFQMKEAGPGLALALQSPKPQGPKPKAQSPKPVEFGFLEEL
jgi:hypothetical protein